MAKTPDEIALERIGKVASTEATRLDLSGMGLVVIPDELWELTNLTFLDLSHNHIAFLSEDIGSLVNLTSLNLAYNYINRLPNTLWQLAHLVSLDLHRNELSEISANFCRLNNLTILNLFGNQLDNLPVEFKQLKKLAALDLSFNRFLYSLPPEIWQLTSLTSLYISGLKLTSLPVDIGQLINLTDLDLYYNELVYLPREIGRLNNLQKLTVGSNQLTELPQEIGELSQLEYLNVRANRLTSLPHQTILLNKLIELDLRNNQLEMPPEILEKSNNPFAILSAYFGERSFEGYQKTGQTHDVVSDFAQEVVEKGKESRLIRYPLHEAKLLLVGQGSVGKTSLAKRLIENSFDSSQNKTEGISILRWQVNNQNENDDTKPEIKINIWDFGGQEIMHATHQFFLTKRSLYLLVLDSRLTQEENRVEYWLKIIQSFGGDSPILIIGNKVDQHPLDIDRTGLQKKYSNIVSILETSAAKGTGIEELKIAITEQVNKLPHVRDLLPKTWFTVKTRLEELGRESNFITQDKYIELCTENEISDEMSQRTLIGFLHDLGVVIHFQDDPRLEGLGILNPQWVTNGVYEILNTHALFENKGVLTVAMVEKTLNLPEYPRGRGLFIVDMMKKFELCYDIQPDKVFLVADLLPKDEPVEMRFRGIPAFEYAYPILLSSVITRFIVRMNQKIYNGFVWRTGVLLKIGENTALVKADIEDRKITIAIDGMEHTRRDALSAVRYQLDEIHSSIKGLDAQKLVPIPNAPNAEPLKYEYLLMLERAGQETHLVQDGDRLFPINVRQILSAIESEAQRKEQIGSVTNIFVGGNVAGNMVVGNENKVVNEIQNSYNRIETSTIQPELKETLKLLAEAVDVMTRSLPEEQAAEAAEDLGRLVDEATKPSPNKKWYSVSIDGLIKAAENVEKVGEPVINLSRKVLSLLTGGVVK